MSKPLAKTTVTLMVDDQGGELFLESGENLGRLPEPGPGLPLAALWGPLLRERVVPATEVQIIVDRSTMLLQCQDVPFLSPKEQREAAVRIFAAEGGAAELVSSAALDVDALAEGGQVLWLAALPRVEMDGWVAAVQAAGLIPVSAVPFQRALLQGLASLGEAPPDRLLLAVDHHAAAHLCYFRGRSLALQRGFGIPADPAEAEELIYEEVNRLLQFLKQKNRGLVFHAMEIVGLDELSAGFRARVRSALRMDLSFLAPALWPVLMEGVRRERSRKGRLNLLPLEIQEAGNTRVFKHLVWACAAGVGVLFLGASIFLYSQELLLEREVARASRLLADRESRTEAEARIVEARIPLLRVMLAERRQGQAAAALSRVGTAIFRPPQGIQLEKVEVQETPAEPLALAFTITGLAFTERSFSVGPLAQYLAGLAREPGLTLEPVAEATISDRVVEGREAHLDQVAITRFTLKGTAK